MDIFEVSNNKAFPSVHILMIEPFKTMWENDTSKGKEDVLKKFTYVELMCSPKSSNPFAGYSEQERPGKVKKEVYQDEFMPIDSETMLAMLKYHELLENSSPSFSLYRAALVAKDKLIAFLENFNLDERTNSGGAVIKPADVTRAMNDIPDLMKGIAQMKKDVTDELLADAKTKNSRKIGQYER